MPSTSLDTRTAAALQRPAWLRAGITTIFAVFTIFWPLQTIAIASYAMAAFFVFSATIIWDYIKVEEVPVAFRSTMAIGAAGWVIAGVAAIFAGSTLALGIIAGIGFIIMGLAETVAALRVRGTFVPARDHLIVGIVGTLTGIGLFFASQMDAHGILGIAGSGVIIMAVFQLISAAGVTHDLRRGRAA